MSRPSLAARRTFNYTSQRGFGGERQRKRAALLAATRDKLDAIAKSVARAINPLRVKDKIGLRIGRETKTSKMMKHFDLTIEDDAFSYRLKEQSIAREAALDGIYVIRTSVPIDTLSAEQTIGGYGGLSRVERAFSDSRCAGRTIQRGHPANGGAKESVRAARYRIERVASSKTEPRISNSLKTRVSRL
jgi:hypothetical protein